MKKVLSLVLALCLCASLMMPVFAASKEATEAAEILYDLGLFNSVGQNADGTPNFDLDRAPTRAEAVTLLVRLLGKEAEAKVGSYTTPFTDVPEWAAAYVGYAYANGLTTGTSATTFSSGDTVSATQYLTFVLRALGYTSGTDFAWDSAWTQTDTLAITSGEYNASSAFTRGDAVLVSANALDKNLKDGSMTLAEAIEEAVAEAPFDAGLYVQGCFECMYKGKTELPGFYDIVDFDAEFAKTMLQDNVNIELDYFYYWFEVDTDYISAADAAKCEQLLKDIYAQSKFNVTSVTRGDNERYTVTIEVTPIALFDEYFEKYYDKNIEIYWNYLEGANANDVDGEALWVGNILEDLRAMMANGMPYGETQTIEVTVYQDADGFYTISDEDVTKFDTFVIAYTPVDYE